VVAVAPGVDACRKPDPVDLGRSAESDAEALANEAGIDLGRVVEEVEHHIAASAADQRTLVVDDSHYRASFAAAGFELSVAGGARLGVSLESVTRGGRGSAVPNGRWRSEGNVAERNSTGGVTERVTARKGEVEWDVLLDREPAGSGPLTVTAETTGIERARRSRDAAGAWDLQLTGGISVQVGEAIVLDAGGREVHRTPVDVTASELRIDVPARVLATASYPLTIDPTVLPARPISQPVGAPFTQDQPDVAFDGTNFLVVWRARISGQVWSSGIGATRVGQDGEVLDPDGTLLPGSDGVTMERPMVVFVDGHYLVAYEDGPVVSGVIVGTDGAVVGAPFPISDGLSQFPGTTDHGEWYPSMTTNGETALVVWQEYDGGVDPVSGAPFRWHRIVGARVAGAAMLDPGGIVVAPSSRPELAPDVASDGDGFLVTWTQNLGEQDTDVLGARVSAGGVLLDPTAIAIGTGPWFQHDASVTFGDEGYLVAWIQETLDERLVHARRIDSGGIIVDPSPLTLLGEPHRVTLAFDGTNFVALWHQSIPGENFRIDVFARRIGQDGTIVDPAPILVAAYGGYGSPVPAVATAPDLLLVVWNGDTVPGWESDVRGARLDGDGVALDPDWRLLTPGNVPPASPAVSYNGTNFLVAWTANIGGSEEIMATRVRPNGSVIDREGFMVTANIAGPVGPPSIATDGTDYLVVYKGGESGSELAGARVSGEYGGAGPIAISPATAAGDPTVAFNGSNYLVVTPETSGDLTAYLVNPRGFLLTSRALTADHLGGRVPVAVGAGGLVLVAWQDGAMLVDDRGATTDVDVSGLPSGETAVATDGSAFLIVRATAGTGELVAARVGRDGVVLDSSGIRLPGSGRSPRVAFSGSWLVVWNDRRATGAGPGIYGARIRPDGSVADPEGFVIAPGLDTDVGVAETGSSGWSAAYADFDAATGSSRMYLRFISPK
jgi:hypothetical protein